MYYHRKLFYLLSFLWLSYNVDAQEVYLPLMEVDESAAESNEVGLVRHLRSVPDISKLLFEGKEDQIHFILPTSESEFLNLRLTKANIISPEGLRISDSKGEDFLSDQVGGFYTGHIADRPNTRVVLSVFEKDIKLRIVLEDGSGYKLYREQENEEELSSEEPVTYNLYRMSSDAQGIDFQCFNTESTGALHDALISEIILLESSNLNSL